jgi:hypothetical protein
MSPADRRKLRHMVGLMTDILDGEQHQPGEQVVLPVVLPEATRRKLVDQARAAGVQGASVSLYAAQILKEAADG